MKIILDKQYIDLQLIYSITEINDFSAIGQFSYFYINFMGRDEYIEIKHMNVEILTDVHSKLINLWKEEQVDIPIIKFSDK